MKSVICTVSGRPFDPFAPRPEDVEPSDIAHALAFTPRFGGHVRQFYSVAQHSLIVCDLVAEQESAVDVLLAALLHDASEAYVLDMPSPIKRRLPDYRAMEQGVQAVIEARFGITEVAAAHRPLIKHADELALWWEQRDLMPRVAWVPLPEFDRPILAAWAPEVAGRRFLERLGSLLEAASSASERRVG